MKIIIDTREQRKIPFLHKYISEIINKKLDVGDYGCILEDGHEIPIYFEKKDINDLFQTLSSNYKRFRKEILRAKESKVLLIIIIEASLSKIIKGIDESQRDGQEVLQQLFSIMFKYQTPFVCCNNREESSRFILETFLAYGRSYMINKKGKK